MSQLIADLALLAIHLGFAALLGSFARQTRAWPYRLALIASAVTYFFSSLLLPLPLIPRLAVWFASFGLFAFFARQSKVTPWQARLAWLYAGLAMLLIMVWSALQGWVSPALSLGVAAAWAALLAWRRGFSLPS